MYRLKVGTVVRCGECSLVTMVEPGGGELVRCRYDEAYYRRGDDGNGVGYKDYFGAEAFVRRATATAIASAARAMAPASRVTLDIGCGGGYLVDALSHQGMDAFGVDTSEYVVERARTLARGTFVLGTASEAIGAERFDLVTMIDVIEHLPNPVATLRDAVRLVRPGGIIMVLTPRYGGRLLADQGDEYVHFNSDHTLYLTEETLRAILARAVPCREVVVEGVLTLLDRLHVDVPEAVAHKYGVERDSMVACVSV